MTGIIDLKNLICERSGDVLTLEITHNNRYHVGTAHFTFCAYYQYPSCTLDPKEFATYLMDHIDRATLSHRYDYEDGCYIAFELYVSAVTRITLYLYRTGYGRRRQFINSAIIEAKHLKYPKKYVSPHNSVSSTLLLSLTYEDINYTDSFKPLDDEFYLCVSHYISENDYISQLHANFYNNKSVCMYNDIRYEIQCAVPIDIMSNCNILRVYVKVTLSIDSDGFRKVARSEDDSGDDDEDGDKFDYMLYERRKLYAKYVKLRIESLRVVVCMCLDTYLIADIANMIAAFADY